MIEDIIDYLEILSITNIFYSQKTFWLVVPSIKNNIVADRILLAYIFYLVGYVKFFIYRQTFLTIECKQFVSKLNSKL